MAEEGAVPASGGEGKWRRRIRRAGNGEGGLYRRGEGEKKRGGGASLAAKEARVEGSLRRKMLSGGLIGPRRKNPSSSTEGG